MGFLSVLSMAHKLVEERVREGDAVVDATVGGGNDTLFLARLVGASGRVYGFDIQEEALARAKRRLTEAEALQSPPLRHTKLHSSLVQTPQSAVQAPQSTVHSLDSSLAERVQLFLAGHEHMEERVPESAHGKVAATMFNLGYLPGGDHSVITHSQSTIPALAAALRLLRTGGVLTVVVYPGHPGGDEEAAAVADWCASLPQSAAQVLVYRFANARNNPPYLIAIEKK